MLSKSKILAFLQCKKRLWLETHYPNLRANSIVTAANYNVGNRLGDIARVIYDPNQTGVLIDTQTQDFSLVFSQSLGLLKSRQPIFEAGFSAQEVVAFADVMLPVKSGRKWVWRMVEVKSTTRVKEYHFQDAAIQSYIAREAGVPLTSIALAHINSEWVYPGKQQYQGLLVEQDVTKEAFELRTQVRGWIDAAHCIVRKRKEPQISTGGHCYDPFECGFLPYCQDQEPQAQHPIDWLPGRLKNSLKKFIEANGINEIGDVPDDLLNSIQKRVKAATLSQKTYFDRIGAKQSLSTYELPAYFMDFETIQFAIPIWKDTRPYQKIPFQFSIHRLSCTGKLKKNAFLDLSGEDPSKAFAKALISACGQRGPIFVYNAGFERSIINDLEDRFSELAKPLQAIRKRLVDLLPIARNFYSLYTTIFYLYLTNQCL